MTLQVRSSWREPTANSSTLLMTTANSSTTLITSYHTARFHYTTDAEDLHLHCQHCRFTPRERTPVPTAGRNVASTGIRSPDRPASSVVAPHINTLCEENEVCLHHLKHVQYAVFRLSRGRYVLPAYSGLILTERVQCTPLLRGPSSAWWGGFT